MSVREMCEAIMYRSDNAAANLLLRRAGGPAGLTAVLRSIGDRVTHIENYEGHLTDRPSPQTVRHRARLPKFGGSYSVRCCPPRAAAVGKLDGRQHRRSLPVASFSDNWIAGDGTGAGDGNCDDVAFAKRPGIALLLISAYYTNAQS